MLWHLNPCSHNKWCNNMHCVHVDGWLRSTSHQCEENFPKLEVQDSKRIYIIVPKAFKQLCGEDELLLLQGILCWLKQAAMNFWKEVLKAHKQMGNKQSEADLCL